MDFFKKISAGAKFDVNKFKNDTALLELGIHNKNKRKRKINHSLTDDVNSSHIDSSLKKVKDVALGSPSEKISDNENFLKEQISCYRNKNRIHFHGEDIPDPVQCFDDLKKIFRFSPRILENLAACGYFKPTPIQAQALPVMLHRREILACAPTGSGKTIAFLLPVLHHLKAPKKSQPRALILSPTRELAQQTHREIQRISAGCGFKSTTLDKFNPESQNTKQTYKKCDVLVTTPNKLIFLMKQLTNQNLLSDIEWLIIDESDKLFEDGKNGFRQQLAEIYKCCDSQRVRRALFSATFAFDVEEWCKLNLDNVAQVYIGAKNSTISSIEQQLKFVGTEYGKLLALRDIIRTGFTPPVLIFVQSKSRAEQLFKELIYDNINVDVIHADRSHSQREKSVDAFRAGKIWVLICTELMGRGIDFKGVNLVINYDFPNSAISYIHRIGRTGRAGRSGRAVTLFTEDDFTNLRSISNVMKQAGCEVPDYMINISRPNKKTRKKLSQSVTKRINIVGPPEKKFKKNRCLKKSVRNSKKGRFIDKLNVQQNDN